MKRIVVRYKVKPDQVEENARLIKNVFAELRAKAPDGVRYLTLSLSDGTFVHFSTVENDAAENPIPKLDAFKAFSKDIAARCLEPPQTAPATVVGNYRTIDE
jgi:L-rhamnose mutarotase